MFPFFLNAGLLKSPYFPSFPAFFPGFNVFPPLQLPHPPGLSAASQEILLELTLPDGSRTADDDDRATLSAPLRAMQLREAELLLEAMQVRRSGEGAKGSELMGI